VSKVYLTRGGLRKLEEELREWKHVRLPEILKRVEETRGHGDLFENAEYHAAREELSRINSKIFHLEQTLAQVNLIDENSIKTDQVRILTTVRIRDHKQNAERRFTLVAAEEADPTVGKISIHSPVGKGLMGKKVGETVVIEIPAGSLEWTILEILPPSREGGSEHGNTSTT
jgi:transcription elongation factor GreA